MPSLRDSWYSRRAGRSVMPHPFFDALSFPWHRPEAAFLSRDLARIEREFAAIELDYQACGADLPALTNANPELVWKEVLENLVLARALQVWCENALNSPKYRPIHAKIRAVCDAIDILRNVVLEVADENLIVLDRENLRNSLDKLRIALGSRRILIVRGPTKSGKSWSKHLVELAARECGAVCIHMDVDTANTVDKVVDSIFSAMGRLKDKPKASDQNTSETAWYQSICHQLLDSANNSTVGNRWWIIMDDLDPAKGVDPNVSSFFKEFALLMASDAFRRKFWLVLIEYPDEKLPTKWKNIQIIDQPNEAEIDARTVSGYLRGFAKAKKLLLADAMAEELAKAVIEFADAEVAKGPGPDGETPVRLQIIHDKLDEITSNLMRSVA